MDNIEIINIALSNLGAGNIQAIDEGSPESTAAKVFYDPSRRAALQKYNWPFATKTERLALTTTTPPDWAYEYELPNDCLKVINIVKNTEAYAEDRNSNPFEIRGTKLLCDLDEVYIVYVYDNEDTNTFSDMFIDAFSHLLASRMAVRITKDRDLQVTELQIYNSIVGDAGSADLNQDKEVKDDNPYVTARN
jgi:hypothetical protein